MLNNHDLYLFPHLGVGLMESWLPVGMEGLGGYFCLCFCVKSNTGFHLTECCSLCIL